MSNDARRFSDEEFALVLRKAMELQDGPDRAMLPSDGMSLDDMRAVARDVGIDPGLVDRAVSLLPEERQSLQQRLVGGPSKHRFEHSTTRKIGKEELAELLDLIRRETGHHGKVTSELDGITWETVGEVSQFHVSVSPRESGTEVRLTVNRDPALFLTWFFSILGGGIAAGITGAIIQPETILGGLALAGTTLTGGLAFARTLWGRSTKVIEERARRTMDGLRRRLDEDEPT